MENNSFDSVIDEQPQLSDETINSLSQVDFSIRLAKACLLDNRVRDFKASDVVELAKIILPIVAGA